VVSSGLIEVEAELMLGTGRLDLWLDLAFVMAALRLMAYSNSSCYLVVKEDFHVVAVVGLY